MAAEHLRPDVSRLEIVHTASMPWSPSPAAGVERKRLERAGPVEAGRVTSVVRYAPGSQFPAHPHPDGEEILVLAGVFSDETGDHRPGAYLLNPEGFSHAPGSREGCELFVKLRQYPGTARTAVRTAIDEAAWRPHGEVERITLYEEAGHPERVFAVRMSPGGTEHGIGDEGGAELFVIRGACRMGEERLEVGGWVRVPPGTHVRLSSASGCTLYVKSGHLGGA